MRGVMNVTFGAIAACTLWAGAFVFIKIGVQWMPPLQFAGWRFLVSGLALAPWVPRASGSTWKELRLVTKRHVWLLLLMGLMQIGLKYAFFYLGLAFVPAALGAMLSGAGPVVVALVARSVSREESISRKMWGAIVLGGMGVAVLTLGRQRIGALNDNFEQCGVGPWGSCGIEGSKGPTADADSERVACRRRPRPFGRGHSNGGVEKPCWRTTGILCFPRCAMLHLLDRVRHMVYASQAAVCSGGYA